MAFTLTTAFKDQTESLSRMSFRNTFRRKSVRIQTNRDQFDSIKGIGLAIVNVLKTEESNPNFPKSLVLLASNNLKIKIPHLPLFSDPSPTDFGIKTRRNLVSPAPEWKNAMSESLSKSEMELSEDYTRVISYGPNPRTTHIFDDCVVESCCGIVRFSAAAAARREKSESATRKEKFLSFSCYHCRKNLQQGKDVYMYRGEKAFCSHECRQKEIMLEVEEEDGVKGTRGSGEDEAMDIINNKDLKLFYF